MVDRLEAGLQALAADLAFPPTPDLRAVVADRLAAPARRGLTARPMRRAPLLAAALTLLLAATVTAAVLLLPGLRLTIVPSLPSADVAGDPLATRLSLGTAVAPETVASGIPAELGAPDEAYVLGDDEVLSLVYRAGDGLPELGGTQIGLLVQRIEGVLDREMVEKLALQGGTTVTAVDIDGEPGFWISGPPHLIRYATRDDPMRSQATRLVGDTLVWERDGVLYRIESGLGMEGTLRIAESIDP